MVELMPMKLKRAESEPDRGVLAGQVRGTLLQMLQSIVRLGFESAYSIAGSCARSLSLEPKAHSSRRSWQGREISGKRTPLRRVRGVTFDRCCASFATVERGQGQRARAHGVHF